MNFLDISVGPILWTIVNFLILFLLLAKFAWKPIVNALQTREATINEALDRAEAARVEAEKVMAENRRALERAEEEAQRVLRESREYSERVQAEAATKAQEESRRLLEQARAEIERSKQQALVELRTEVANLAVGAAEKILNEQLDEQRQRRLVDDYLQRTVPATN